MKKILITLAFACFLTNEASPLRRVFSTLRSSKAYLNTPSKMVPERYNFDDAYTYVTNLRAPWNKLRYTRYTFGNTQPNWNTVILAQYKNGDTLVLERMKRFDSPFKKNVGDLVLKDSDGQEIARKFVSGPISKMGIVWSGLLLSFFIGGSSEEKKDKTISVFIKD